MTNDVMSRKNVIAINFAQDSSAYEALTRLKELDSQRQIGLDGAAVVARGQDGQISVKDDINDGHFTGTAGGGIVGLLVGILGGPLGILIGGFTGLLLGSIFDAHDAEDSESVLADISTSVRVGGIALLADVSEQSPEVIDSAMDRLGGTVFRLY